MRGRLYLDTMHADHANLIMRYLSIRRSNLETGQSLRPLEPQNHFYNMQ